MADVAAVKRQLRIQTGVVNRLNKELMMYKREKEEQMVKVDKKKADGADDADIRSATIILREAEKMVPDAEGRLAKAVAGLREVAIAAKKEPGLSEDNDLHAAESALEEAEM